jgi:hypothetical protein
LASFEGWSDFVRSPLVWLGEADPVESIKAARADDPERNLLRGVLLAWADVLGVGYAHKYSLADVVKIANERSPGMTGAGFELEWPELSGTIQAASGRKGEAVDANKFGLWMRGSKGRIIDGLRFVNDTDSEKRKKTTSWWVEGIDGDEEKPGRWTSGPPPLAKVEGA